MIVIEYERISNNNNIVRNREKERKKEKKAKKEENKNDASKEKTPIKTSIVKHRRSTRGRSFLS